jgi:hypothetical protein
MDYFPMVWIKPLFRPFQNSRISLKAKEYIER